MRPARPYDKHKQKKETGERKKGEGGGGSSNINSKQTHHESAVICTISAIVSLSRDASSARGTASFSPTS